MDHTETDFLKTQDINPWFWKRFVDSIFFIWTESEASLEKFLEDLNKFHPNLKFTCEKSKDKINFLDVVIKIKYSRIITDLYWKPTDGHQYLYYDSCDVDHIKRSIIFSQTLRLKRLCSENNDLNVHVEDLKTWFRKREHPHYLTKKQVEKAPRLTPSDENNSKKVNGLSLVVTYNPAFKNLLQVIRKNLQLFYADELVRKVFSPAPFASFKSTRNLKSYLVRSKIYPLERKVGSEKCKSKCCLACLNVSETDVFQLLRPRNNIR